MSDPRPLARPLSPAPLEIDAEPYIGIHDPWGAAPEGLALPLPLYSVLALCDGARTLEEIQAQLVIDWGGFVSLAQIERVVSEPERHALLEGPEAERRLRERLAAFHSGPRPAVHAGQVYPSDPAELTRSLDEMISSAPAVAVEPGARALVAPHIDFERGGAAYGAAYGAARQALQAETFIVLGVSHHPARGLFTVTRQAFDTPLGPAEVDDEAAEALAAAAGEASGPDELLHLGEHSVEFQVVFLRRLFPEARIVPILCSHLDTGEPRAMAATRRFARALRALLARAERPTALVAGVDLTHVGPEFGHPERDETAVRAWARQVDRAVLEAAAAGDAPGVLRASEVASPTGEEPNVCGQAALHLVTEALAPCTGTILHLGQAPTPSGDSWVGFGAALLYDGAH